MRRHVTRGHVTTSRARRRPALRVRRGPLQWGCPVLRAVPVTSRCGGQSAAGGRGLRRRRSRSGSRSWLPVPVPVPPWPSAAAPRRSRTTPSRCVPSEQERPWPPWSRSRCHTVSPVGSRTGTRGAGRLQPLRQQRAAAVPGPVGAAAPTSRQHGPAAGRRAAPAESQPHRAPELRLVRHAGNGAGGGQRDGRRGGGGRRRQPQGLRSPAGLGGGRHGRAAEAAGGAEPESGGAGPAGAGAAERGPRRHRCEAEQLAPAAVLLPGEALLLPGHPGGDPRRLPEDRFHHVLPLDGQHHRSFPELLVLTGLVLCGALIWFWVWPLHSLGPPLHALLLCLLVQAHVQSFQNVMYVLQAIGIPNWGFSGWILSLIALRKNTAVAVMMILVSLFFTAVAVLGIIMLKKIHSLYRRTGASFQKAQEEFAAGVFSNQAVRTAAANAAAGAATNAFRAP
ncbi:secretory carrier-associated membrane protein 3 isoform 1-T1 [Alca torda]